MGFIKLQELEQTCGLGSRQADDTEYWLPTKSKEASPKHRRSRGSGYGHSGRKGISLQQLSERSWCSPGGEDEREAYLIRWGRSHGHIWSVKSERCVTKETSRSQIPSSNRNQGDEQRNKHVSLNKKGSCPSKLVLQIEDIFSKFLGLFFITSLRILQNVSGSSSPPTPTAPRTPSFHTHQTLNPLLCFNNHQVQPVLPKYCQLCSSLQGCSRVPGKTDSPFPCSYQLSLTSQIRVDFMTVSLLCVGVLSGSSLPRSRACCHNCCEFICIAALWCPKDAVPVQLLKPLACTLSVPFPVMILEPLEEKV